jgi:shikimate kinase
MRTSRRLVRASGRGGAHLVLVGLPGSGKTTIGKAVAEKTSRPFLDFDAEIEREEGRSIPEIFRDRGETYFRGLEAALTRQVAGLSGMVLSPGGGWMTRSENVGLIRDSSLIVYLKVRPETALQRLGKEGGGRPLIAGPNPLARLQELARDRSKTYETADIIIDTELAQLADVIDAVAKEVLDA